MSEPAPPSSISPYKRRHGRESWRQPVVVQLKDASGTVVDRGFAEVRDLSFGGARLHGLRLTRGSEPNGEGHHLCFTLILDEGSLNLDVATRAMWTQPDDVIGVSFENVDVKYRA